MEHLPEYLRLTVYGQKIQDMLDSKQIPQWVSESLIYNIPESDKLPQPIEDESIIHSSDTEGSADSGESSEEMPERRISFGIATRRRLPLFEPPQKENMHLPTAWNVNAQSSNISVSGREISTRRSSSTTELSFRSDHAVPPLCGTYYYEIQFESDPDDQKGIVGFTTNHTSSYSLIDSRLPCWLYFGEDGKVMTVSGAAHKFGPSFGAGDVIGCGLNFRTQSIFFTKNGIYIGQAFTGVDAKALYPFLVVKSGARFTTNFGSSPFRFDINKYVLDEKKSVFQQVDETSENPHDDLMTMIQDYLIHMGYKKSLNALKKELDPENEDMVDQSENQDSLHRQQIRDYILERQITKARETLEQQYPGALSPSVEFELKCQEVIEYLFKGDLESSLAIATKLRKESDDPKLKRVFGLFAYPDPENAPYGKELFGQQALTELSTQVNSAVLLCQGLPNEARLSKLISETIEDIDKLSNTDASASHINVLRDIFS